VRIRPSFAVADDCLSPETSDDLGVHDRFDMTEGARLVIALATREPFGLPTPRERLATVA
jgi:hypothetical protein